LLHAAGIADAKLFVIAIDGKDQITELARYLHHQYPDLKVVARAVDRTHVYDLWNAGCRDIIRENYDSALRMGRSSLEHLGAERAQADAAVAVFDVADRKGMIEVAEHYDPAVPAMENEALIAKFNEMRVDWEIDLKAQMKAALAAD
jgi:CPA2 family monovalent cation:H+ antiporter-2